MVFITIMAINYTSALQWRGQYRPKLKLSKFMGLDCNTKLFEIWRPMVLYIGFLTYVDDLT